MLAQWRTLDLWDIPTREDIRVMFEFLMSDEAWIGAHSFDAARHSPGPGIRANLPFPLRYFPPEQALFSAWANFPEACLKTFHSWMSGSTIHFGLNVSIPHTKILSPQYWSNLRLRVVGMYFD